MFQKYPTVSKCASSLVSFIDYFISKGLIFEIPIVFFIKIIS